MKNNLLKYYIVAVYLCSTFIMFAQPGEGSGDGGVGGDVSGDGTGAAVPIDTYVLILALLGLFIVFMKFKAIQKNSVKN